MQRMKSFIFILIVMLAPSLHAQEMEIVDVTHLVQYVKGDKNPHHVAVANSFAKSDRGRDLLERVKLCNDRALNFQVHQETTEGQEKIKESGHSEIDKIYDEYLAFDKKDLDAGRITAEEYEKRKAHYKELSDIVKKDVMKSVGLMTNAIASAKADNEMPEDPEKLLNELYRYVAGGQSYWYIDDLGNGLLAVTHDQGYEHKWGVINLLDKEIFPQQYSIIDHSAKNSILVLEKENKQRGLFRYNGECVIQFQNNELWIDPGMDYPVMATSTGFRALDTNGKLMFSYPEIRGEIGFWRVRNKEKKWGVVANDGTVLIPVKYIGIDIYTKESIRYVAGYYSYQNDDADLYDPKTWNMIGKKASR